MVSWSNLEKLCSCSRTWMVSALACGNKWIQVGTYRVRLASIVNLVIVTDSVGDADGNHYTRHTITNKAKPTFETVSSSPRVSSILSTFLTCPGYSIQTNLSRRIGTLLSTLALLELAAMIIINLLKIITFIYSIFFFKKPISILFSTENN